MWEERRKIVDENGERKIFYGFFAFVGNAPEAMFFFFRRNLCQGVEKKSQERHS